MLWNAKGSISTDVSGGVAIGCIDVQAPRLQRLHVIDLEVADAVVDGQRGHVGLCEVDGSRRISVPHQPLLR